MSQTIPVIDLFAGPGGLNEGFSQLGENAGAPIFETIGSYEMETTAIKTLRLRSVYRTLLRKRQLPSEYYEYIQGRATLLDFQSAEGVSEAFELAQKHIHEVELGGVGDTSNESIQTALADAGVLGSDKPWVLIGGPPCQAYSLAGRSRRANDESFANDKKHFLYREYLRIIQSFAPPVFVMENVKGLLSSTTAGKSMFDLIQTDLTKPKDGLRYDLYSLVTGDSPSDPRDFIIHAEDFGVPQKRHRVIILGIKRDHFRHEVQVSPMERSTDQVTVKQALNGIAPLRSGISPAREDSEAEWLRIRKVAASFGTVLTPKSSVHALTRGGPAVERTGVPTDATFADWVIDPRLSTTIQHQSRSHMADDLRRYWFAASSAKHSQSGNSPRLSEFPRDLQPNHRNASADARPFEDRFRVQVDDRPSTTIVSHISKDGHYYIHPDPAQMRSLTVREAARLQSFPDNYFFEGNRTQQYHQVGNAVPPLLAKQIAEVVAKIFGAVSPESD